MSSLSFTYSLRLPVRGGTGYKEGGVDILVTSFKDVRRERVRGGKREREITTQHQKMHCTRTKGRGCSQISSNPRST